MSAMSPWMNRCVAVLAPAEGWEPICRKYQGDTEFLFVPPLTCVPKDDAAFSYFLTDLMVKKFDAVVMTCPTVVRAVIDMANERGMLNRFITSMQKVHLAVIGDRTAESARWNGLKVSSVSPEVSTDALIKHVQKLPFRGNIALLRSDRGTKVLPRVLNENGWQVTEVPVYSPLLSQSEDMELLLDRIERKEVSALAFPTPLQTEAFFVQFFERFGEEGSLMLLEGVKIAAMSAEVVKKLDDHGVQADVIPKMATAEYLIDELVAHL
jgi:uroporphyrinogen-III synthase